MAPQLVAGLKVQGAAAVPTLFPGADHLPILPLNLMVTLNLSVLPMTISYQVRALPVLHGADYLSFGFGFGGPGARVVCD